MFQMKTTGQRFCVVLFIIIHKVAATFVSRKCNHSIANVAVSSSTLKGTVIHWRGTITLALHDRIHTHTYLDAF